MTDLNLNFKSILAGYLAKFLTEYRVIPVLGCELEFYVKEQTSIDKLQNTLNADNIHVLKEEGENQYELKFTHTSKVHTLLDSIENAKKALKTVANFQSYQYVGKPPSALHIHLNFFDQNSKNIFDKQNAHNPKILSYSIGGLLKYMPGSCIFFAPTTKDYRRYTTHSMTTPSTISWGINNRTTAIRLTPRESGFRRIEHRLSTANANPEEVISVILASVYHGIKNRILAPEPIYGNAFDSQYGLEKLPQSLKESQKAFMQSNLSFLLTHYEEA